MGHRARLGLEETLVPVIGNSHDKKTIDSVPNDLDFIYIDGSHETEDIYLDIINWTPKVKKDGLILFHDHTWPRTKKAVKRGIEERIIRLHTFWGDFGIYKKEAK